MTSQNKNGSDSGGLYRESMEMLVFRLIDIKKSEDISGEAYVQLSNANGHAGFVNPDVIKHNSILYMLHKRFRLISVAKYLRFRYESSPLSLLFYIYSKLSSIKIFCYISLLAYCLSTFSFYSLWARWSCVSLYNGLLLVVCR